MLTNTLKELGETKTAIAQLRAKAEKLGRQLRLELLRELAELEGKKPGKKRGRPARKAPAKIVAVTVAPKKRGHRALNATDPKKVAEAKRLRGEGMGYKEISKRTGVAMGTIWGLLNKK